ncbi:MAG: serine hydrolase domain-containing protein [Myxococcota bacterium]
MTERWRRPEFCEDAMRSFLPLLACVTVLTACGGPDPSAAPATADAVDLDADVTADASSDKTEPDGATQDLATDAGVDTASAMDPARAATLATFVTGKLSTAHLPGLAAGIVKDGKLAWVDGYGWADIAAKRPATPDTLFLIASVSKTVTAAGVAKAWEQGKVDLDADVNQYLPFAVHNPNAPKVAITLRMLLSHTSSLIDDPAVILDVYTDGDSPVTLGDFLRDVLTTEGKYWNKGGNWDTDPPNTRYEYSDIGISLAGFAVECAVGMGFDQWCEQQLFAPLGLAETSWKLAGLDLTHVAMPYGWSSAKGYTPYGHYGYPDYPDGRLRTSVNELSRYLRAFMGDGKLDGVQVLKAATVAEMKKIQFPKVDTEQAMAWWYEQRDDGLLYCGHTGRDSGVSTQMFFQVQNGVGVIVLTNGDVDEGTNAEKALLAIEARLFEEAALL